jgi:acetolactate decarboxylase
VPGWHLHLVTADRTTGGHLLNVSVIAGHIAIERETELTIEVPAGVDVGTAGADASRDAAIADMERGR